MSAVLIREARATDVAAVAVIERASFGDPWTPAMFAEHLGSDVDVFVVAESEGAAGWDGSTSEVVGFAVAYAVAGEAELLDIAVRPDLRGRGVGDRLLAEVFARCAARGAAAMTLEVRASNAPAQALYARHGFVAVGRRRRYYREPVEDALVMRADMKMNFPAGTGNPAHPR